MTDVFSRNKRETGENFDDSRMLQRKIRILAELRRDIPILKSRCLGYAAQWLCELGMGIELDRKRFTKEIDALRLASKISMNVEVDEVLCLAQSYIMGREYRRAVNLLEDIGDSSPKAVYYRSYASMLAFQAEDEMNRPKTHAAFQENEVGIDRVAEESSGGSFWGVRRGLPRSPNKDGFQQISSKLDETWEELMATSDVKDVKEFTDRTKFSPDFQDDIAFLAYIHGACLQQMRIEAPNGVMAKARRLLLISLSLFPLNWNAWLSLLDTWTFEGEEQVRSSSRDVALSDPKSGGLGLSLLAEVDSYDNLRSSWMRDIFEAKVRLDFNHNAEALRLLKSQRQIFIHSAYLQGEEAYCYYLMREFDEAEKRYSELLRKDRQRTSVMDTYSHILYVLRKRNELALLAKHAAAHHKFSAEACSVIGNYYSLRGDRANAILYFRRAITLNASYVSAWTLMGHEYLEMSSPSAAIGAYRCAIDLSPRDFRAWYSAGQAYELLQMHEFAMYYYSRAVQLRPHDSRMWAALANCLTRVNRIDDAIAAYRRGALCEEDDGLCSLELGGIFISRGDEEHAVEAYTVALGVEDKPVEISTAVSGVKEAFKYLIRYHTREGNERLANYYSMRLESEIVEDDIKEMMPEGISTSMDVGDSTFISSLSDADSSSLYAGAPSPSRGSALFSTPVSSDSGSGSTRMDTTLT